MNPLDHTLTLRHAPVRDQVAGTQPGDNASCSCETWSTLVLSSTAGQQHAHREHAEHVAAALAETLMAIDALLSEYEATVDPAPYTSERALYERLRHLVPDFGVDPTNSPISHLAPETSQ